jgi:hypothetical protein
MIIAKVGVKAGVIMNDFVEEENKTVTSSSNLKYLTTSCCRNAWVGGGGVTPFPLFATLFHSCFIDNCSVTFKTTY